MAPRGAFIETNGPFYFQTVSPDDIARYCFLPEDRHCNSVNFAHGGIIATFLDNSMAQTVANAHGYALVTTNLSIAYEGLVAKDHWAVSEINLQESKDEYVTAEAVLRSRGAVCVRATGVFKLMLSRPLEVAGG